MTSTDWSFEGFGPEFDTHVHEHLPGYEGVQEMVATLAEYLLPNGGVLADYGASTGTTAKRIADRLPHREIDTYLYDEDRSMLDLAKVAMPSAKTFEVRLPAAIEPVRPAADLSLALWFLQFLHPRDVPEVLRSIRRDSRPGGALLVASKVREADGRWVEVTSGYLDDHKSGAGVSPDLRVAKTRSLRGAMFPPTTAGLLEELRESGWVSPMIAFALPGWVLVAAFAG